MDPSVAAQFLILIVLLALSAFFSSSETALSTVNRIRVRTLIEEGNKKAITLGWVIENSGKMLSAILIGNNVVNISASSIATILATDLFDSAGAGIATGTLTLLVLIFGEITPKTLATIHAEKIALQVAGIIKTLMTVLTPVIFIVNKLSMGLLILLRVNPNAKENTITESELRTIVDVSHEEGVIESEERRMINNVFDFGDSRAKDVMIPRIDMTFASIDCAYEELIEIFRQHHFTRIPVYEESTDNVIGIVNMKDLLLYQHDAPFRIQDYLREPYYTYEYKKLSELMVEMRKASVNIVIVLDEYGVTAGLITLEDLLEEIVGDIKDEYDEDEEEDFTMLTENEYLVDGQIKLDDINELLKSHITSEDYDSLGGHIMEVLDRLPQVGDSITEGNLTFIVETLDKNRIDKIHIYCLPEKEEPESISS